MSTPNIITQIAKGAVTIWDDISKDIETDIAKVEAVFPSVKGTITNVETTVKQGASDILGAVASGSLAPEEQALISGVEGLADSVLTAATGGLAVPLVGATNDVIQNTVAFGYKALQAWALKRQASLAENNAALAGGGSPQS